MSATGKPLRVRPVSTGAEPLPEQFSRSRMSKSLLVLVAIVAAVLAVVALVPGLSSLRDAFKGAEPAWLLLAGVLQLGSCASYVVMFRKVFCERMQWSVSAEIGLSELAANSLLSVGGAGGLALGAWILRRGGVATEFIARRTVAFFLLTSLANVGFLVIAGIVVTTDVTEGPRDVLALGIIPAAVGLAAIAIGLLARPIAHAMARRATRPKIEATLTLIGDGVAESLKLLRTREPGILLASAGYMLFDVAALAVCFTAFGNPVPPLDVLLIAYIVGQLGGLIPLPGGIGGLDLGLIGALVLYGVNATDAAVAVIAYRGLLLLIPAAVGLPALALLRRRLRSEDQAIAACMPGEEVQVLGRGAVRAT